MVELKQRILTSLSNLSDRDTHHIAIQDLEKTIQTLTPKSLPMTLNCLCESSNSNDSKPIAKRESLRLLTVICASHGDLITSIHDLARITAAVARRLRDSDSGVRDACGDAIGALSMQYLKGERSVEGYDVVSVFVKPLFEAMGEEDKGVQSGAARCMVKMVECASNPPILAFQKMCPRICKLLNNQNFLAKAAILSVVASLSQVGAITPQSLEQLLPIIHECLNSTDWATRKAAADALSSLALHSSSLVRDEAASTLVVLESCRFDKIKPVRDSMTKALQLWKKISGIGDGALDDPKPLTCVQDLSANSSSKLDSFSKAKSISISEKAIAILEKKAPALLDKELNPEFFQELDKRGSDDLPIEVVVPRRCINPSTSNNEEEPEAGVLDLKEDFAHNRYIEKEMNGKELRTNAYDADDKIEINQRESSAILVGFSKTNGQSEGSFVNNRGNRLAIQRQLLQLERQQAHLMNMMQDFMGVYHDRIVTLENRVQDLERVVEDMAQDISVSSGCRGGGNFNGFNGCYGSRPSKYISFDEYFIAKYGRNGDGQAPYGERQRRTQSDGNTLGIKGRGPSSRFDMTEAWGFPGYSSTRNDL